LIVAFFHPVAGLMIGSVAFFLGSIAMLALEKGAIHEGTAATLAVGAFICAGLAGVIRKLAPLAVVAERSSASRDSPPTVEATASSTNSSSQPHLSPPVAIR
jgi:hypothetical protein